MTKPMKIKIDPANSTAIEAALKEVNGRARDHTYNTFEEIANIAAYAEKTALEIVGAKSELPGYRFSCVSGSSVPNAYKYSRQATRITILRGSGASYLVGVSRTEIWKSAPGHILTLTQEQDQSAVRRLRARYLVAVTETAMPRMGDPIGTAMGQHAPF